MKPIFTTLTFFLFSLSLFAQPGMLDKSFGNGGIVVDSLHDAFPVHIALQPDGKSVAAGSLVILTDNTGHEDFLLMRRNTDGTPDSSFGDKGSVTTSFGSSSNICSAVAIQTDGDIVAAGTEYTFADRYHHIAVARYAKDGSLDPSFGKEGLVNFSIADKTDAFVTGMALQRDGKVVVTGNSSAASNEPRYAFIVRFNTDGTPDAGFGNNGVMFLSQPYIELYSVVLQPDGNIVVGGTDPNSFSPIFIVFRYLADGEPDKSFGTDGEATHGFGDNIPAVPYSLALGEDGSILFGGYAQFPGNEYVEIDMALVRFTPAGSLDLSFGTKGEVITKFSDWSEIHKILIQPDGKIIAAGTLTSHPDFSSSSTLVRYFPDGTIDSSFGTDGITTTTIENGLNSSDGLLQGDGKILLADGGSLTTPSINTFVFARYNNDISQRQRIITRIKRWIQHHGITWQGDNNVRYYNVQRSLDGGITYLPVARLYNNHQPVLSYEDGTANNNALYRVAAAGKDGSRTFSNSLLLGNESSVKLFPNPVHSTLQLQGLPADSKSTITVTDFTGNVRTSATASGGNLSINTAALKPGNYLLKVQSSNATSTQAFVKE